jgi:hypothetical protein
MKSSKRIFQLFTFGLLLNPWISVLAQTENTTIELKRLSHQIDSLTKDKYNRSAFLDRGMGENYELYDSLETEYYETLKAYLLHTRSLKNIEDILIKETDLFEVKDKRIFQWEFISGGTQEETNKLVQIIYPDSIQVYSDVGNRTYGLYYLDDGYLEFESKKGCSTCCEEKIFFKGKEIYSINYRDTFIEELFTYDEKNQTIKIEFMDIYIDGESDEDYSILNETVVLQYDGTEFVKQK